MNYNKYLKFGSDYSQNNIFNSSNKKNQRNYLINDYSNKIRRPLNDNSNHLNFKENENPYINTSNFGLNNIFNKNKKVNNEFNNSEQDAFHNIDRMEVDMPTTNDNIIRNQYISNSNNSNLRNFNSRNFENQVNSSMQFHNKFNNFSVPSFNLNSNLNSNSTFSLENKLNNEQYRFPKNSSALNNYYSYNTSQSISDTSTDFPSTVKRIKFSNDTPTTSYSHNMRWSLQNPEKHNINSKTPSSIISKFTPLSSKPNILSTKNSIERSFLIKQQERISIRENSNSNGKYKLIN